MVGQEGALFQVECREAVAQPQSGGEEGQAAGPVRREPARRKACR